MKVENVISAERIKLVYDVLENMNDKDAKIALQSIVSCFNEKVSYAEITTNREIVNLKHVKYAMEMLDENRYAFETIEKTMLSINKCIDNRK